MALLLSVIGLGIASCSSDASFDRAAVTTAATTASTEAGGSDEGGSTEAAPSQGSAEVPPEVAAKLSELNGRLAVGAGNRLSLVSPDGSEVERLEDAAGVLASQPTWSSDGNRLAWSRSTANSQELVVLDVEAGTEAVSRLQGPTAFYLQWSAGDRGLVYLRNDANGRGVEMGLALPGSDASPVAATQPFFVAWAPSGSSMAAHVGGTQVIVLADLFDGPQPDLDDPLVVLEPTGTFTTPVWVDDSTLLVAAPEGLALIDVSSNRAAIVVSSDGPVRFVVSPDRSKVAYHLPGIETGPSLIVQTQVQAEAGLVVLDLASGDTTVVTDQAPVAWEWSPDSKHLAWLDPGFSPVRPQSRWQFWDGETSTPSAIYSISQRVLQAYLPFFEQYAHSQSGWSPDSAAFAFAGRIGTQDGTDAVWVQLVGIDTPPVQVAEGDVVTWSR